MDEMNSDEMQWVAETTTAIAHLQAKTLAQGLMLEALITTHPHPTALRDQWDRLVSLMAAKSMEAKARSGREDQTRPELTRQMGLLTEKVERYAPRTP